MKNNKVKNAIYSALLLASFLLIYYCQREGADEDGKSPTAQVIKLEGKTMGTTYHITFLHDGGLNLKEQVDSVLMDFNMALSTYIPESEISQLNREAVHHYHSPYFYPVLKRSKEIYEATGGAFDPTVLPLVEAWGFGSRGRNEVPDAAKVRELLNHVSYDSIFFDSVSVCRMHEGIMLDMSAIAKGYGVDVIHDFMVKNGLKDFMVEIGGEVRCKGRTAEGKFWAIGIDDPTASEGDREIAAIVELNDKALASSGNYRNYYEKDGVKYAHTISPFTGYPVSHSLLGASVVANDCMTADAYATAFMVLGLDSAKLLVENTDDLEAFLIYSEDNGEYKTWASKGMAQMLRKEN